MWICVHCSLELHSRCGANLSILVKKHGAQDKRSSWIRGDALLGEEWLFLPPEAGTPRKLTQTAAAGDRFRVERRWSRLSGRNRAKANMLLSCHGRHELFTKAAASGHHPGDQGGTTARAVTRAWQR